MRQMNPEEEMDWGEEAYVEIPDDLARPLTREEIDFWFEELYPDGTPIPVQKRKIN